MRISFPSMLSFTFYRTRCESMFDQKLEIPSIGTARGGWYVVTATFFARVKPLSPDCELLDGPAASAHAMPHILRNFM